MDIKQKGKIISFDPSELKYRLSFIPSTKVGGHKKYNGPYWYGYLTKDGKTTSIYFGRTLPDECKPFAEKKEEAKPVATYVPSHNGIRQSLFKGNQVIIDIASIALACDAEFVAITPSKFLLYRDIEWTYLRHFYGFYFGLFSCFCLSQELSVTTRT